MGVTWGFGDVDELRGAGAAAVVDTPAELGVLLGDLTGAVAGG